jgi:glyoxylase-like metal-dependent hydrolase (beta-lactamase superfamily II)
VDVLENYTGHVDPEGPAARRTLDALTITKISVGPMDNNAYLLRCQETGDQVLVDAAAESDRILELIGHGGLSTVVTTHRHHDHWGALADVITETGAVSVVHAADASELPVVHATVADGDVIDVGDCRIEVIHLVGHTPGSIALLYRDPGGVPHLFTGDSLFPGGVGRTTNPADFGTLIRDVETKLFGTLPDETWFYPGHGRDSTLGAERASLPEWRARGW